MYVSRRLRFRSVLLVLFSMLFMQLAVAGFVCPLDAGHAAAEAAAVAGQDAQAAREAMPGCAEAAGAEVASAHLCHAHCQIESQSLEKHELPTFQGAPPDPVLSMVVVSIPTDGLDQGFSQPAAMTRATSPPISIRNCCFRT